MADDFYDEEEEELGAPPVPKFWVVAKKAVKYLSLTFMLLFFSFLLWRVFFSENDPASMQVINPNEKLSSAYSDALSELKDGEVLSGFAVYQTDDPLISTCEDWHDEDDGVNYFAQFFLTDAVYFPRAHQAQFVLRYNNSALRYLAEDYSLPSVPEKGGDWFDLTLVVVYEYKASEDALPIEKELRLRPVSTVSESTSLYNYRQLTFEGLPELETVKNIYFDIYYIEDADYAKTPYSRIRALNGEMSLRDYTLDKKDIAALTKGGK
jgi:hypothetical protein